ncbi:hypothetical protein JCM4814A_81820 [Streptomyces phaeofaciens JCM 4814]|uniref:Uncharacterized protein n=1 Tax=Streptomyces phaeofaciens TaxID=68254 RepID=A0A918HQG9_9ACTN|nr:hypothetical protein [Streptomyces phaeofaciens]GGT89669.1 hypothetical protein GCM10010226_79840 [Streptomyces phaeofaciens]
MMDELRPGRAEMNRLTTTLRITGETESVVAMQVGYQRQAISRGSDPAVNGGPRLQVDFSSGQALLYADRPQRQQVGERLGNTVRLWSKEYRVHRRRLWPKLLFTVSAGERTVLRVRERFGRNGGARVFDTHSDAALDPVVALALLLLEGRPHTMGFGRGDYDL